MTRMIASRAAAALAASGVTCLLWGCTGESATEITPPTARDRLADDLAATLCEGAASCCTDHGYDAPGDSCRSAMRNAVMASIISAEDQARELVPEAHEGCIDAFEAAIEAAPSCDYLPAPLELEVRCPTMFTPIPEGTGQPGDACAGTHECASPTEAGTRDCVDVGNGTSRCVWFVDRAAGQPCTPQGGTIPVCAEGLTCRPDGGGMEVCATPPGPGQACVEGRGTCVEGYVCAPNPAEDLVCVAEIPLGEACDAQPTACARGLFCNVEGTCNLLPDPCATGDCPTLILQNVCR